MLFHRVPRIPRIPPWAPVLALAGGLLEGAWILLGRRLGLGTAECSFKRITGHPCPTCGSTRGVLALLHGRPLEALALNPLVFGTGALVLAAFLARLATGRAPTLSWTPANRRRAWAFAILAVLANWLYLDLRGI
jgi:hypothetical protein